MENRLVLSKTDGMKLKINCLFMKNFVCGKKNLKIEKLISIMSLKPDNIMGYKEASGIKNDNVVFFLIFSRF